MASWKKVVVSGSSAELASLTTSGNLTATGNLTVNGNTTLGNAASDTLTIKSTQLNLADGITANANRAEIKFNTYRDPFDANPGLAGSVTLIGPNDEGGINYTLTLPAVTSTIVTQATSLNNIGTAALNVDKGGTGQTTYADGELLIGNTSGNTLTRATLTAGSGISITNGNGSITITQGGFTGLTSFQTASIADDLTVGGNLYVNGDITNVNTTNLLVEDAFVLLASGSSATGDSGIIFGGSEGTAQSGTSLFWDASYNTNDGRLSIANGVSQDASSPLTPAYRIAGVVEGSETDALNAQADHPGNIRIESGEIYIYV